ncbi:MAG: S8 family serine peptidase [Bacteroidales bacterium]|nr:S8 family serine peptidase [Bacteroidales bacterium]
MFRKTLFFLALSGAFLLSSCSEKGDMPQVPGMQADVSPEVPAGARPGHLRVKFKNEPAATKAAGLDLDALGTYTLTRTFPPAGRFEERHRRAGLHLWYDIRFDGSLPLSKAGQSVSSLEDVEVVEYVPEVRPMQLTYPYNDPQLPKQWNLQNPGGKDQWAEGCDVNAFRAWTIETGKPEVIVAVNDMGVDYTHEDLAANMWVNTAEYHGKPGEDDDGNGFVDDIYGYSFMSYDGETLVGKLEPGDHGTHVAGTIAAVNNNGTGVAGVAGGDGTSGSGVRIMSTQTLDGRNNADTPASFVYAADNGAVLVNCSWGFVDNVSPTPQSYVDAIDYFNTYAGVDENGVQTGPMIGGLVIFAAGNDGRESERPAMDDNVFAVAALSANYVRSYFTSYGEWVDISAPGGDANRNTYILSTLPDNTYGNMQGSSMAAPHVTGVAALIISHYGVGHKGFTRDRLIWLLQSTADKKALEENGSYATRLGAGLVDAYAALQAASDVTPNPVTDLSAKAHANYVDLSWTVPAASGGELPFCYRVFYSEQSLAALDPSAPAAGVRQLTVPGSGYASGDALAASLSGLSFNTTYHFRICSEALMGRLSSLSGEKTETTGANAAPKVTPLDGVSLKLASHASGTMRFSLEDPDGHPMSYTVTEEMPGMKASFSDGVVTLTINALQAEEGKTYPGVLTVTDGYAETVQKFSYTILENHAPEAVTSFEDHRFGATGETLSYRLGDYFRDSDGEELSYTATLGGTALIVNCTVSGDELTVKANSYGSTTVTVTATDARGLSASSSFRVLVRDSTRPYDLYPNPVKDVLYLRAGEPQTADVTVSGKSGAVVFSQAGVSLDPFEPLAIDLSAQPGGSYYVRVGGSRYTIVKQ